MRFVRVLLALAFVFPLLAAGNAASVERAVASPIPHKSFFGMDLYVTGQERPKLERLALLGASQDLGVRWSREEISWANLELRKGAYNWADMDYWINQLLQKGISVVGTIQTTPSWASGVSEKVPDWYWHVPQNPQDFVDFAGAAAAHYAGRIDVWEIWNEPDVEMTFKCDGCNRAAVYAQMLAGSYAAIKKANPNATVLIGGLSIHDYSNGGMVFLDHVVAASGGKLNFDVLSIHPYMPDRPPESTDPNTVVQNFPYRLDMSYKWLQSHGAPNKDIWITEDGYSTCTCGSLGVSEEEQARRLVRLYAIAMAAPNVTQFDYFQLKDKFNAGPEDLWGNMAIMRTDFSHKPSYTTYKVLTQQLAGATFLSQGPLMRSVPNRWQPQFDRYHYKFARGDDVVHVIWKLGGPETVSLSVSRSNVQVFTDMGKQLDATVSGGAVSLSISEDPIYVVDPGTQNMSSLDPATDKSSPTGFVPSKRFEPYWQNNGALPLFGYALTGERLEKSQTNGKEYIVQWFERARFEYHPEYAGTQAEVLLGLLGSQLVKGRTFPRIPPPTGVESICTKETGHCVWGHFLERWRKLGIPIVGLPLSDQFEEQSTDGKTYVVQYFERARFEYHPENNPPYDVLLGLLGRQMYRP